MAEEQYGKAPATILQRRSRHILWRHVDIGSVKWIAQKNVMKCEESNVWRRNLCI